MNQLKLAALTAIASLAALPTVASANWLDSAKSVVSDFSQGKTARAVPAEPVGMARDSWGTDEYRDTRKPSAKPQDERFIDDRFEAIKETAVESEAQTRPVKKTTKSRSSPSATPAPVSVASCANVSRAWEGASNWAESGQEEKAYAAYVRLLSTCKSQRELEGTAFQAQKNLSEDYLFQLIEEPIMASDALALSTYKLKASLVYKLNKKGDTGAAMRLLGEIKDQAVEQGDSNLLNVAGYAALKGKKNSLAVSYFKQALKADRDNAKAREGLALAYLGAGKSDAAFREADRLLGDGADELKGLAKLAQARDAFEDEEYKETLSLLKEAEKLGVEMTDSEVALKAWALNKEGQHQKSAALFQKLNRAEPQNEEYATGLVDANRSAGNFSKIEKLAESSSAAAPAAKAVIADQYAAQGRTREAAKLRGEELPGSASPVVSAGFGSKSKSGDAGEGKQTITIQPEVSIVAPVTEKTRIVGAVANLRMADGVRSIAAKEATIGYQTDGEVAHRGALLLSTTLGNSKIGFDLGVRRYTAGGFNEVTVLRSPVYDSVRSYAGVNVAGVDTGRVMSTVVSFGGNQQVSANWKMDYNLSFGSMAGKNVNNNGFFMAKLGGTRNLSDLGLPWLTMGPQAHVGGFREDQNQFNAQDGGYFSPKADSGMGMRAFLATEEGNRYILRGSAYAGYANRTLADFTDSGLQLEGDLSASYLLNSSMILSAGTVLRTSPGYTDSSLYLSLSLPFSERAGLYATDIVKPSLGLK